MTIPRKVTDRLKDGQTNRPYFIGPSGRGWGSKKKKKKITKKHQLAHVFHRQLVFLVSPFSNLNFLRQQTSNKIIKIFLNLVFI